MAQSRDWLKTLWSASFKGQTFYFESDGEEGGRDNVKHQFPNRDDPFIEDLGSALRYFSGAAYIFGDNVDQLDAALKSALDSRGPGTLVTPLGGPVSVHCETFKRSHEKDKLGYVAFEVKFVRAGAASALISVPLALNIAFQAADAAAASIASNFASSLQLAATLPDYVVAAASDALSGSTAALDVIRQTYPVDTAASGSLRDAIAGTLNNVSAAIVSGGDGVAAVAANFVAVTRDLSDAMPAGDAARAMLDLADASLPPAPPAQATANALASFANMAAAYRLARLAALTAWAEAILRAKYRDRPSGVTARAEIAARFEAELYDTRGADDASLYLAIDDLRGKVIEYLSQQITNLAPLITVTTARSLPALYLAWHLYADPFRAPELVARNNVRHPAFMPKSFIALAR